MTEKKTPLWMVVDFAEAIMNAHAEAAEADAGFDGGEFSGPAHHRAEEREITKLAEQHGYTYEEVMDAHSATQMMGEDRESVPSWIE